MSLLAIEAIAYLFVYRKLRSHSQIARVSFVSMLEGPVYFHMTSEYQIHRHPGGTDPGLNIAHITHNRIR